MKKSVMLSLTVILIVASLANFSCYSAAAQAQEKDQIYAYMDPSQVKVGVGTQAKSEEPRTGVETFFYNPFDLAGWTVESLLGSLAIRKTEKIQVIYTVQAAQFPKRDHIGLSTADGPTKPLYRLNAKTNQIVDRDTGNVIATVEKREVATYQPVDKNLEKALCGKFILGSDLHSTEVLNVMVNETPIPATLHGNIVGGNPMLLSGYYYVGNEHTPLVVLENKLPVQYSTAKVRKAEGKLSVYVLKKENSDNQSLGSLRNHTLNPKTLKIEGYNVSLPVTHTEVSMYRPLDSGNSEHPLDGIFIPVSDLPGVVFDVLLDAKKDPNHGSIIGPKATLPSGYYFFDFLHSALVVQ